MTIKSDRQQRRDYRKAVEPWPAPSQKKGKPELRGEDPQCLTEVLFHCLAGVRSANSPTDLLDRIVIYGVNEFKTRRVLTKKVLEDLLCDFRVWMHRTEAHLVGSEEEVAKVWQLLEQVIVAAREKHLELTDTSGSGGVGFEPPGILSFLVLTINSLVRPFLTRAFFIS